MVFYSIDPEGTTTYTITQNLTNVTSSITATSINAGEALSGTLTADEDYTISEVVVTMGGLDISATAYSEGAISIGTVTGNVTITATATSGA